LNPIPFLDLNCVIATGAETPELFTDKQVIASRSNDRDHQKWPEPDENILTSPPVFTNSLTGELNLNIPCLVFANRHYPKYQFKLRNSPADVCTEPHWHSPNNSFVYSLEVTNSPISDPNPPVAATVGKPKSCRTTSLQP